MAIHKRVYRYRFYPTAEQAQQLAQSFGCARHVYNWALGLKSSAYEETGKSLSHNDLSKMLTQLKRTEDRAWLNDVSNVVLQQSLRHLDRAYSNFFAGRGKFPRFKRKSGDQSAHYMANAFTYRNGEIKLAKQSSSLDIRWSRSLPKDARISSLTVSKDAAGRYHISLLVEEEIAPLEPNNKVVGLDLGIKTLVTPSHGEPIVNPKTLQSKLKRLRRYQHQQSRRMEAAKASLGLKGKKIPKGTKIPKSKNFVKSSRKIARLYAQVRDSRDDYLHKTSTALIRENQAIGIEDLYVAGMVKNPKLARSISDASFGRFRSMLEYKAKWYGRDIILADRWYPSSKTCSSCNHKLDALPLSVRHWTCPACGDRHDRDQNAALNLRNIAINELNKVQLPRGSRKVTPVRHDQCDMKPLVEGFRAGSLGCEAQESPSFSVLADA